MATFLYRCPKTGFNIQGWTADEPSDMKAYVSVDCPVCKQIHLVNPATGKGPAEADAPDD
jgi:hypothetical protein